MKQNNETGQFGEDLACEFLVDKDYRILERNYRKPWGELDIVARARNGTLVFIEVKTIRQSFNTTQDESGNAAIIPIEPEDNLTAAKLKKLQRTAQNFVGQNSDLIDEKRGWRIDLVAITLKEGAEPITRHYENI